MRSRGRRELEPVETLYRVVKTRDSLKEGEDAAAGSLYEAMQRATEGELGEFRGGTAQFYEIYRQLRSLRGLELLEYIAEHCRGGDPHIPAPLIRLFDTYLEGAEGVNVLFTDCECYGPALYELAAGHPDIRFVFTCGGELLRRLLARGYCGLGNVEVIAADIHTYGFSREKFDLIFAVPALRDRRLMAKGDFICRESDLAAAQNLLYHLALDGRMVIVLSSRIAFAGGDAAILRKYMEENYQILEIAELPPNLFAPDTALNTLLCVFSQGTTDSVVVKRYREGGGILTPAQKELLFREEFSAPNGWRVGEALAENSEIEAYQASPTRRMPLGELASIFRGKAVSSAGRSGEIGVVQLSNLTGTGIQYTGMDFIGGSEQTLARYILRPGDVLVAARGTVVKAAVFEGQPYPCIPSANLNVIRPGGELRGMYLKLFFETPVGIAMLERLRRGTTVMNINYRDLGGIEVPVPPLEQQDRLVEEYQAGLQRYQQAVSEAEREWETVLEHVRAGLYERNGPARGHEGREGEQRDV